MEEGPLYERGDGLLCEAGEGQLYVGKRVGESALCMGGGEKGSGSAMCGEEGLLCVERGPAVRGAGPAL